MKLSRSPNTAIITGGASGLGRAVALQLAEEGWDMFVTDINEDGCRETLELVERAGGSGEVYHFDVRSEAGWQELLRKAQAKWPQCDLLLNNAGVSGAGEVGKMPMEDWRWIFDINFFGYLNGCHTFVDWLKDNPRGASIINTCSAGAFYSCPTMGAYSAAKAAVLSLSETIYAELLNTNVSTTVVLPYFFPTNILNGGRFQCSSQKDLALTECRDAGVTAREIARAMLNGARRKQFYVFVPFKKSRLVWVMKRFFPRLMLRVLAMESQRRLKLSELPQGGLSYDCK